MRKLFVILFAITLQGCNSHSQYKVNIIPDSLIRVDAQDTEEAWSHATRITSFTNPWNKEVSPETSLSILKDTKYLYFYFNIKDNEILVEPNFSTERDIEKEDRAELFFSKKNDMSEYYCFEMDAKGRVLSYAAQYYRQFNFNWEPPEGFSIATDSNSHGYTIEGAIPLKFILNLSGSNSIYFGAYRTEFSRRNSFTIENWLTWIDPKTAVPDFHVPNSLGILKLSKEK